MGYFLEKLAAEADQVVADTAQGAKQKSAIRRAAGYVADQTAKAGKFVGGGAWKGMQYIGGKAKGAGQAMWNHKGRTAGGAAGAAAILAAVLGRKKIKKALGIGENDED